MKNISIYTLIGTFLLILFWGLSSQAGISSQSYRVPAYVLNGGGLQDVSENFHQVASLGESTPTGFSQSGQFKNYAGFIPQITTISPEICDGIDNDGDGLIDEDLIRSCSMGCGPGTEICVNGEWVCTAPVPPCPDCNATRSAPDYAPGFPVTIQIEVNPDAQITEYTVEDTPPAGWLVSDITEGGIWDSVNKKVKWGPFSDNTPRTLAYNVEAPSDANGCYPLSGHASIDGNNQSICGDIEICDNPEFVMNLSPGWSMISLPMIPDNATFSALFPEAEVMYMYERGAGYVRVKDDDDLEAGRGYWILLNDARSYSIKGQPIQEYTLPVHKEGWEMIGGCSSTAQALADHCNIVIIYSFYNQTGYKRIPEGGLLEPCKGYWILISDTDGQSELRVTTQF